MALSVICTLTFAAYTSRNYKKGVASMAKSEPRFSSDVLQASTGAVRLVTFTADAAAIPQTVSFSVNNYPQGNSGQYNERSITYEICFTLIPRNPNAAWMPPTVTVNDVPMDGLTYTLTEETLPGGSAQERHYAVAMPYGDYTLRVELTPDENSVHQAQAFALYCDFRPVISSAVSSVSASAVGSFADAVPGILPQDCHAFVYRVSLQNYSGTFTLNWENSNGTLQPDAFFRAADEISGSTWTHTSDAETQTYELVFYRTHTALEAAITWEDMNEMVQFNTQ